MKSVSVVIAGALTPICGARHLPLSGMGCTRAGAGSKVVCLGNLAQIDTPYLSATSFSASRSTASIRRLANFPRKVGMMQNAQAWLQPSEILR